MPHKKNPILSENLTGLARLIRSNVIPSMENIALWHERDISHSAVERNIGPDATIALDFALTRLSNVIKNLNVYPKNMEKNLNITNGIFFSQRIMLELTSAGFSREEAYKIVQKNAMKAWKEENKHEMGAHQYSLEEFNLDDSFIDENFSEYINQYIKSVSYTHLTLPTITEV